MSAASRHNGRVQSQPAAPSLYIDVQRGTPLVGALAVSSALTLISTALSPSLIWTLALVAQLAAALCFCTLFIRVKDGYLLWQFGPGWIRGEVALSEIRTTTLVMSPFAYGWGFQRSKHAWRFDRRGALAIVIDTRGGKRLRLGTSRAHELQRFLSSQNATL